MNISRLSRAQARALVIGLIVSVIWIAATILFGWWAAAEIDGEANQRQAIRAQSSLSEVVERLPKEQDSSAIWNAAVLAVRENNGEWLSENLVEWMSEYYDHERVYVLTPENLPLRTAIDGTSARPDDFDQDAGTVLPIVERLRTQMQNASTGQVDSTEAIYGMGLAHFERLADDSIGVISVRPILPETDAVPQAPGQEYLHVSIEILNSELLDAMGTKFDLANLEVTPNRPVTASLIPLQGMNGQSVGWLSWSSERPAWEFLWRTLPALGLALVVAGIGFSVLVLRLGKTSRELQQSEAHVMHLAFHDQLTGIPNRALFEDRLERALTAGQRAGTRTALHYLDLDHFKTINDTLGHPSGDELVRQVAERLKTSIREVDTVARIGGDEFAIVQVDVSGEGDANILCERVLSLFQTPFSLHGEEAHVGASIGTALQQSFGSSADLMRQADIALYEAKAAGKGRHRVFAGEMDEVVKRRRAIEKDLRRAIEEGDGLALAFQPIYSTRTGAMVGAEALARWNHPVHGALSPEFFIGLAEERGLIERLGMWALREAAQFAVENQLPWIAVNFSPIQFRDEHLAQKVAAVLSSTGLDSQKLQVEITEGVLLQDSPIVRATINTLRAQGISVALDDFGTGYSSISYLRKYGVDKLKIDRSFVAKLGIDIEIESIVQAIIDLSKAMQMTVTAEGVETEGQLQMLTKMGCTEAQGFLLSRPLSAKQMSTMQYETLQTG